MRESASDILEDREAAIAGIEDSYGGHAVGFFFLIRFADERSAAAFFIEAFGFNRGAGFGIY